MSYFQISELKGHLQLLPSRLLSEKKAQFRSSDLFWYILYFWIGAFNSYILSLSIIYISISVFSIKDRSRNKAENDPVHINFMFWWERHKHILGARQTKCYKDNKGPWAWQERYYYIRWKQNFSWTGESWEKWEDQQCKEHRKRKH